MANSIVQTIREAEIDARSLSEFIYNPADAMVSRRLAPSIHTLNYYLRFFDTATTNATADAKEIERHLLSAQQHLSSAQQQALGTVSYIENTIRDAIDTTVIENSPVSDALVSVDGSLSQRTINKGLESVADLSTIANPKDGLRVYVKSYYAGLGKGGGHFVYSESHQDDGNGLSLNGWKRDGGLLVTSDMYGLRGDGITEEQRLVDIANSSDTDIYIPKTDSYYYLKRDYGNSIINSKTRLIGVNGTPVLENDVADSNTLDINSDGVNPVDKVYLENLHIKYNWWDEGAETQTNNRQALRLNSNRGFAFNNEIEATYMTGTKSAYGPQSLASNFGDVTGENFVPQYERQPEDIVYLTNRIQTNGMGMELFSTRLLKAIGNSVKSKGDGKNHGYRITGYAAMPHVYSSIVGNSALATKTGYSLQAGTYYNTINAAIVADPLEIGLQVLNAADEFNPSRCNYFQGVISNSKGYGTYLDSSYGNRYDLLIDGCEGSNAYYTNAGCRHNLVDAVVLNSSGTAASIRDSNSIYRMIIDTSNSNGASISGSNNIIDIIVKDSGYAGVSVSGHNNIIRIIHTGSFVSTSVQVLGSNNNITVDCEKLRFESSALNNTITGNVSVVEGLVGGNNDVSGLSGCSFSKRYFNLTTSEQGRLIVEIPLPPQGVTVNPTVNVLGATESIGNIFSAVRDDVNNLLKVDILFRNFDGTPFASNTVTFSLSI